MHNVSGSSDPARQCECYPRCIDIAAGVLMQRHGLTADEARGTLTRTAARQHVTVHLRAQEVIESAFSGSRPASL